jgi:hypothetical protein
MTDRHRYPDPNKLLAYADEPVPFHNIGASDLEITEDDDEMPNGVLCADCGNVEYHYHPSDINVETAPGEWESVEDVSHYDMDHPDAFDRAINLQIEEDFICATEFVTDSEGEPAQFEAFWVLETVTIHRLRE